MSKRSAAIVALVSFWGCLFLSGCSPFGSVRIDPGALVNPANGERTARKTPEVLVLKTPDTKWKLVKLVSLTESEVKVRSSPYESAELARILVDEIAEIELGKNRRGAITGMLVGMSRGVLLSFDYRYGAWGGILAGATSGLVGYLVGSLVSYFRKTNYNFSGLSHPEKIGILKKIMGIWR